MTLAAAGFIGSTSALLADTPVTPAEAEKIKAALMILKHHTQRESRPT